MNATRFKTLTISPAVANGTPTSLAQASLVALRVLVRNLSGTTLFVGENPGDCIGADGLPTVNTFRIPVGQEEVFVIAPKQSLLAVAIGAGAIASIAVSEALPLT
jgi:hypothetical protein